MRSVLSSLEGARSGIVGTIKEQEGQLKRIQMEEAKLANSLQALQQYEDGCSGYFSSSLPPAFPPTVHMPPMGLITPASQQTGPANSQDLNHNQISRPLHMSPSRTILYTHPHHPPPPPIPSALAQPINYSSNSSRMPTIPSQPSLESQCQVSKGKQTLNKKLEYKEVLRQQKALEKKALEDRQVQNFLKRKAARENNLPLPSSTQEFEFMPLEFMPINSDITPNSESKSRVNANKHQQAPLPESSISRPNEKNNSGTSPAAHLAATLNFSGLFSPPPGSNYSSQRLLSSGPPPPYSRRPSEKGDLENQPPLKRIRETSPVYEDPFIACHWQSLVTPALKRRECASNRKINISALPSVNSSAKASRMTSAVYPTIDYMYTTIESHTEQGNLGHSAFLNAQNAVDNGDANENGIHQNGGTKGEITERKRRNGGNGLFIPFVNDSDDDAEGETDMEANSGRSYTPPPPK
jgi:hypothetical protein